MSVQAQMGNKVKIHYTGKLEDGSVFDTSEGKDPLEFLLGEGKVIPGFENAVIGMKVGEKKDVVIPPEQAYGSPRQELVRKLPKSEFKDVEPQVGMVLGMQLPGQEQVFPARVVAVAQEEVSLDLNPPLAGKTLHFTISLVSVE